MMRMVNGKNVEVFLRGDGVHVAWLNPTAPTDSKQHRHEIILKLERHQLLCEGEPQIDRPTMDRIRAFSATLSVQGDPKKIQQKQERSPSGDGDEQAPLVVGDIKKAFLDLAASELQSARDGVKHAVMRACALIPFEEIEETARNALAEYVMKS